MKAKKGLQKLTEFEKKIEFLMQKKRITLADINGYLTQEERNNWGKILDDTLCKLEGSKRDALVYKIAEIMIEVMPEDVKN